MADFGDEPANMRYPGCGAELAHIFGGPSDFLAVCGDVFEGSLQVLENTCSCSICFVKPFTICHMRIVIGRDIWPKLHGVFGPSRAHARMKVLKNCGLQPDPCNVFYSKATDQCCCLAAFSVTLFRAFWSLFDGICGIVKVRWVCWLIVATTAA